MTDLAMHKKGPIVLIKIYNNPSADINTLSWNVKQIRLTLSNFLNLKLFCILDEYFNSTNIWGLDLLYESIIVIILHF
jgi:hypothetical protein